MSNRHTKILEIVNSEKKVEVTKLSDQLGVSQVTIRKDLDMLEKKGLLRREHGFAMINSRDDINIRLVSRFDIKKRIAKKAAQLVDNGECIMIESGSSCTLLAEELAASKRDITIITNSAFIAAYVRESSYCQVVLLGGEYQKNSQVTVGPVTKMDAAYFHVDKLFIGIDGYDIEKGFSGSDLMRAEVVKAMAQSANHTIVLTDSSKFNRKGLVPIFSHEQVSCLVTDVGIPDNCQDFLINNGVRIETV